MTSINTEKKSDSNTGLASAVFVHTYYILHLFLKWDLECQE